MSAEHLAYARRCPACAAVVDRREWKCWVCEHVLAWQPAVLASPGESLSGERRRKGRHPLQFSLSSLFFFTTVISIHFGVLAASPALGLGLLIIGLPALIRTFVHFARLETDRPTVAERCKAYVLSVFVTIGAILFSSLVLFASGMLLFVVVQCVIEFVGSGALGSAVMATGMILGLLAASTSFVTVYWKTLPRARRRFTRAA